METRIHIKDKIDLEKIRLSGQAFRTHGITYGEGDAGLSDSKGFVKEILWRKKKCQW
ncbi:MAG: hypothetical protein J6N76_03175 [Lachnospiraceae bacterium]|nr:hypothetical protein [Lachnospiraceae bacterium]